MIHHQQLKELIIEPTLYDLQMYSKDAVDLLLFTAAVESKGGTYLKQIKGPALGIYQMEPKTYNYLWENYIKNKSDLTLKLIHKFNIPYMPEEDRLIYDLRFATVMTRLFYARLPEPIPKFTNDKLDIWSYYKKYYNTNFGKSNRFDAMKLYFDYVGVINEYSNYTN